MPKLATHTELPDGGSVDREFDNIYRSLANAITAAGTTAESILTGTSSPTATPEFTGQRYINTTTAAIWIASGTSGSYNWGYVGQGSTSAFDKNTVPGLLFWYDASDSLTIVKDAGNNITNIYDKSTNGYHLAPITAAQKPLWVNNIQNGLPAIYFNPTGATATGMKRGNLLVSAQPITWFFVIKPVRLTYGATQQIADGDSSGRNITQILATTNKYDLYAGTNAAPNLVATSNTTLITAIFNGSSSTIQANDTTPITSLSVGAQGLYGPTLGSDYNNNQNFAGYMMVVMAYSGALSSTNLSIVQTYLNNKWAIY